MSEFNGFGRRRTIIWPKAQSFNVPRSLGEFVNKGVLRIPKSPRGTTEADTLIRNSGETCVRAEAYLYKKRRQRL